MFFAIFYHFLHFLLFFHFFIIFLSFLLFWKNLIKRSIIFFPAFDRSIECTSHMTYDMDSKTFFCQQNLSETFVTCKKITKKCVSRIYIYIYMQKMNFLVIFLEASLFRFRLTLHLFFILMPRVTGCPRRKNNVQKCFKKQEKKEN